MVRKPAGVTDAELSVLKVLWARGPLTAKAITEAVYPRVSKDHDHIPIRVFYFDGTQSDLDRDVGIFLELAKTYKRRKKIGHR